jgi:hypothetical protein
MRAFAASYKLGLVIGRSVDGDLTKIFGTLESYVDLPIRRIDDRSYGQSAGIIGDPDLHISLAFDQAA